MKYKNKQIKIITILLLIISLLTLIYSSTEIIKWIKSNKITKNNINDISKQTVIIETDKGEIINSKNENKNSDYWSFIKMNMIDVDFNTLKKKNNDTIGWIKVNGTNINYPIVQSKDNDFYLTHSFNKEYTDAGWIFLDYRNDINNMNKNNIIYGHARLDKTMFGTLKNTLKSSWYNNKNNHVIKISTEKENTLWQIFSVYSIKTESYYITTNFNNNEYSKFIKIIKDRSIWDFDSNVDTNDIILTLSTCHNVNEKIVVHSKLIKKETK